MAGLTGNDLAALKQKDPNNKKLDKPKAYLNYVFFDKQLNFVEEGSGVKQVDGEAGKLETLASGEVVSKKDGYVYVFTSNESEEDVFFDNLSVYQSTGPILEETHYYPFGLVMDGISTMAPLRLENNFKYNGKELNHDEFSDGSSLEWYNYGFRDYDPQIGRFIEQDPLTDRYATLSPYQYAANDPIANIDYMGLGGLPSNVLNTVTIVAKGVHRTSAFSAFTSKLLGTASLAGKIGSVPSIAVHGVQVAGSVINGLGVTIAVGQQAEPPGDYYDKQGNWLYNDGINDNKVYEVSPRPALSSELAGAPNAAPIINYVGKVKKVKMTFTGNANPKNLKEADGKLNIIQKVSNGKEYTRASFDAVGGPWGNGSPENGNYKVHSLLNRGPNGWYNKGMTVDGIGFSLNVDPLFKTGRSFLRIHSDGGRYFGTQGCIGLTCGKSTLLSFKYLMQNALSNQTYIPLRVNILNNPNNNGFGTKIKSNGE